MMDLTDKVVLVSGGARGIGAAVARATVAAGGKVVIGDVLDEDGRNLADELGAAAAYVHLDVTDPATWDVAVATAVERYGRLGALVNNAGIAGLGPIDAYPRDAWDRIIAVNLTGVFNGIQAAVPALQQAGGGSIVNVSSVAGLQGIPSSPGYVAILGRGRTERVITPQQVFGRNALEARAGCARVAGLSEAPASQAGR